MLSAPAMHSACNQTLYSGFPKQLDHKCAQKARVQSHFQLGAGNASQLYTNRSYLNTAWRPCEMMVFQDQYPTEGFYSYTHSQPCCFHPLGGYTNPPPPVPPFLLILNQSPKDIAGSGITNCLTHTR